MCHLRDRVAFDQFDAGAVAPDLARVALGRLGLRRFDVKAVHVDPLVDDLTGILPSDQWIATPTRAATARDAMKQHVQDRPIRGGSDRAP